MYGLQEFVNLHKVCILFYVYVRLRNFLEKGSLKFTIFPKSCVACERLKTTLDEYSTTRHGRSQGWGIKNDQKMNCA